MGEYINSGQTACKSQFVSCRKLAINASYVAANCLTKLGALIETLRYLVAAQDQLGKVDNALGLLINSSDNMNTTASTAAQDQLGKVDNALGLLINSSDNINTTASTAAARQKRQAVMVTTVTTVQVIEVVIRYQTIISSIGKWPII